MDKKIIFAVAGSGKTSHIIDSINEDSSALILTYTENNWHHIRNRVIKKFGHIPKYITVMKFFTFLYSECYKPFLNDVVSAKGINWNSPPGYTFSLKRSDRLFYIDKNSRLYGNRISKLIIAQQVMRHVKSRIEKYYDYLYIDEIQDFGGHDFDFIKELCTTNINICFVGDFYQHTFDTSRDGTVHRTLHKDYADYVKNFTDTGLRDDKETLSKSYRCAPDICEFITEKLGIIIDSHKEEPGGIHLISGDKTVTECFYDEGVVKLFFQEHHKYDCYSNNWGNSKGMDNYLDVCIPMYPKVFQALEKGDFTTLPASSLNKLYVALTRANRTVYIAEEKEFKCFKSK